MKNTLRELSIAASIAFIGLFGLFMRTDRMDFSHPDFMNPWDHHKYIQMAEHNVLDFHIAPFAWRILNPLLAKILPFTILENFTILNFVELFLTAIFIYLLLRNMQFSHHLGLVGLLFFLSLGWATRYNLYDFWLTDPLSFLFVVIAIWGVSINSDIVFVISLAFGVLSKESVLFVGPLYYTLTSKSLIDKNALFRSIVFVLPAISILFLVRVLIKPLNGNIYYLTTINVKLWDTNPYTLRWLFYHIGVPRIHRISLDKLVQYSYGTFGFSLIFLPFFSIKENFMTLVRFAPFILLTFISLLFATNENRLIVAIFPVVILMGVQGMKNIAHIMSISESAFLPFPIILLLFLLVKDKLFVLPIYIESSLFSIYLSFILQWKYVYSSWMRWKSGISM